MEIIAFAVLSLLGMTWPGASALSDSQEAMFPRRSCLCDIGVLDHVMIMPIHEKSRPLKNCAVAVEYCKEICGPAVARQILGFRDFSGLQDVTLQTKPFWNMQRTLGDMLCQNLGRETKEPLELAVYSQAKSCGRRVAAVNGSFTDQRLCCHRDDDSAIVRAYNCQTGVSAGSALFAGFPTVDPVSAANPQDPSLNAVPHAPPVAEPIEMLGEIRSTNPRMSRQFRAFLDMLHRGSGKLTRSS